MASDKSTLGETITYIRLETIAATFSILVKFITVFLVTIKKDSYMYILLGIQTVLSIVLDTFLISKLPFAIDMGVNGIALANIAISIVMLIVSLFFS